MEDEVLAASPLLTLVRLATVGEGPREQVAIGSWVVRGDLAHELLEELVMALRGGGEDLSGHISIVAPGLVAPIRPLPTQCDKDECAKSGDNDDPKENTWSPRPRDQRT
jgi:hypothetical protein